MRGDFFLLVFYLAVFSFTAFSKQYNCSRIFDESVTYRVCYMSLNNSKERTRAQGIFDKAGIKAEVIELIDQGEKPLESLEKNLAELENCPKKNGANVCDTMVISGHHDGSFRGELIDGPLIPEELLLLSCRYKKIFESVKSLYLQGCNTIDEDLSDRSIDLTIRSEEAETSDVEPIADSRKNPDYQNTNILRSTFFNASTQGWGLVAPSIQSLSENSLPIDLMVKADFEMWLKEKKGIDGSNSLTNQQVAIMFNEYIQLTLSDFRYSSRRSETQEALDDLKSYIGEWDSLVDVDPVQCIWDYYQKKYYHAEDKSGKDLRVAKSLPSAKKDGLKNFCQDKGSGEKLQEVQDYLDGKRDKKPENLQELFKSPEDLDVVIPVLNQSLGEAKDEKRLEELQDEFGKSEELEKYFLKKREKCIRKDCLTQTSSFEMESEKQTLTGKKISTNEIANSCEVLKNLYEDIVKHKEKKPNQDEVDECKVEVTSNFCDQSYRDKLESKVSELFDLNWSASTSLLEKSNAFQTFYEQASWCVEKSEHQYQFSRLKSTSCQKRVLKNTSKSCLKNPRCLPLAIENSFPNCFHQYFGDLQKCENDDQVDVDLINKQSEFVNLYNEMIKTKSFDRKQLFFDIPECKEILKEDSLRQLPPIAKAGVLSIADRYPNNPHIPRNFSNYANKLHQRQRVNDISEVYSLCREISLAKLSDRTEAFEEKSTAFKKLLKEMTKEQWREVISRRDNSGKLSDDSLCITSKTDGLKLPNFEAAFNPTERTLMECMNIASKDNFTLFNPIDEKKCCNSNFLCEIYSTGDYFKITPFCAKINKPKYKTVSIESTSDPHLSGDFQVQEGETFFNNFSAKLCHDGPAASQLNGPRFDISKPGQSNMLTQNTRIRSTEESSSADNSNDQNLSAICKEKPKNENRHKWLRQCCSFNEIEQEMKDKYCRSAAYCTSKLSESAVDENLISKEEQDRLKGEKCCYEAFGLQNQYDGINICEDSKYRYSTMFRSEYSAMNWLRMCVNWDEVQQNQQNYQMSCRDYFKENKFYRIVDQSSNPKDFTVMNMRLKYSSFSRFINRSDENKFWYYPRKDSYYIESSCLADEFVRLCSTSENNQSKELCESNISCVYVPSKYFSY